MNVPSLIDRAGVTGGLLLVGAVCCGLSACGGQAPPAAPAAVASSRTAIAADSHWRSYVLDVSGDFVTPKAITVDGDPDGAKNAETLLSGASEGATLTTRKAGGTRLIIDLGLLASGYVELGVVKASGAPIRMSYAEMRESLHKDGDASTDPNDFFYRGRSLGTDDDPDGRADVFKPPAQPTTLVSPGLRGSERYIAITLDGPGMLTVNSVRVRQTNFRGSYDGHFLSSDEKLNRAWYASAYAVDLSTVRNTRKTPTAGWVLVDGPKRDRVVYPQDLGVSGLSAYYQGAAFRAVLRNSIYLFSCQQAPDGTFPAASVVDVPCPAVDPGPPKGPPAGFEPPGEVALARLDSFTLWWVIDLADYQRYSGDRQTVAELLPVARRALQFFAKHAPEGALWRADNYDGKLAFNWHTPDKTTGIDAFGNEAYYGALRALARLERSVAHDEAAAKELDDRADKVRAALFQKLWDPTVGAFLLNTEDSRRNHAADANVGALWFGLVTPEQAHSVMNFLGTRLKTPYGTASGEFPDDPYMTQYVSPYVLAIESVGRFRYGDDIGALDVIRTAWSHMLEVGPGTPWEEIGMSGKPVNARPGTSITTGELVDAAHAWSTAVPALSMFVLGVRPLADGYREWAIEPHPADLQWAQGEVPSPAGSLSVRWKRGEHDSSFLLTVDAPDGTSGQVGVPLLRAPRTIAMDGRIVWQEEKAVSPATAHREGDAVIFTGIAGRHTFAWTSR